MLDPAFGFQIVLGMALLLGSSAVQKFRELEIFRENLAAYRIVPERIARRLAILIPCTESIVAAGLLFPLARRGAVVAAIGMLAAYAAGMGVNLARGRNDLECGCGSMQHRRLIESWMIWRNVLLSCLSALTLLTWIPRPLTTTDVLTIIGGVTAATVSYAAFDRLLGDIRPRARWLRRTA